MPTPADSNVVDVAHFPRGLNNRAREYETSIRAGNETYPVSEYARKAINVDITSHGTPLRRPGFEHVVSGAAHSLWSDPGLDFGLCVRAGELRRFDVRDPEGQVLQTVHASLPISYATVNGAVYWSNIEQNGVVQDATAKPWGVVRAPQPGVENIGDGAMPEGRYRVALTYIQDSQSEGGASQETEISLPAETNMQVTVPGPFPAGVAAVAIYLTEPNGELLYMAREVAAPGTYGIYPNMLGAGRRLETTGLAAPPPGHLVEHHSGRIYISRGSYVFFTEPLRYDLVDPATGVLAFDGDTTLLESVQDGLYVSAPAGTFYLQGTDPYDLRQIRVSGHQAIPGTATRAPGYALDVGHDVPVWWDAQGKLVAGLPGGTLQELTADRLDGGRHQVGASFIRHHNGMLHAISSLSQSEGDGRAVATDSAVAQIRTNRVVLN